MTTGCVAPSNGSSLCKLTMVDVVAEKIGVQSAPNSHPNSAKDEVFPYITKNQ